MIKDREQLSRIYWVCVLDTIHEFGLLARKNLDTRYLSDVYLAREIWSHFDFLEIIHVFCFVL